MEKGFIDCSAVRVLVSEGTLFCFAARGPLCRAHCQRVVFGASVCAPMHKLLGLFWWGRGVTHTKQCPEMYVPFGY